MKSDRPEVSTSLTGAAGSESPTHSGAKGFYKPLLRGLAWTAGGRWSTQVLTWITTLIIARVLSPSDYGIVGMATVYLGLITLLSEFGLGTAVVYLRDLTESQIAQLNTISIVFGVVAFLVSCGAAYPLAWFFKTPALVLVVVTMSTSFVVMAFQTVPYALCQKAKSFGLLAIADAVRSLIQAISTLVFAILGLRYWSLVIGGILGACASVVVINAQRRTPFARPKRDSLRKAIEFSRHIITSRLSWYGYSNADFVVAGRVLGQVPLGAYTVAWNLASSPTEKVTQLISLVIPSFVSEAQKDPATLRRYVRSLTEGISLLTFPATVGLALVARDFIHFALGEKWVAAIVPLEMLALYATIRSITTLLWPVLQAVNVRWSARYSILFVVVFPTGFFIASHWGIAGIAAGWVCLYPIMYLPIYRQVFRGLQMSLGEYMRSLWPAISGTLVMAAVVAELKLIHPRAWPYSAALGVEIVAGAGAYLLVLGAGHRERLRTLASVLKSAKG